MVIKLASLLRVRRVQLGLRFNQNGVLRVRLSFRFHVRFGGVASSLECGGRASSLNKCGGGGDRAEQVARW